MRCEFLLEIGLKSGMESRIIFAQHFQSSLCKSGGNSLVLEKSINHTVFFFLASAMSKTLFKLENIK